LSAIAGRADIMRQVEPGNVVHAGTNNGNVVCVAAALATLTELARDDGAAYRGMTALGSGLMASLSALAKSHGRRLLAQGPGPIFSIAFTDAETIADYRDYARADHALMAAFADALLAEGVRIPRRGTFFLSTAHGAREVERTLAAADAALARLATA
jgi:glutamate-1-semialdehyde 2,1-aminomutase